MPKQTVDKILADAGTLLMLAAVRLRMDGKHALSEEIMQIMTANAAAILKVKHAPNLEVVR